MPSGEDHVVSKTWAFCLEDSGGCSPNGPQPVSLADLTRQGCVRAKQVCSLSLPAEPVAASAAAVARHGHSRRRAQPPSLASHRRGHPGCPGAHLCRRSPLVALLEDLRPRRLFGVPPLLSQSLNAPCSSLHCAPSAPKPTRPESCPCQPFLTKSASGAESLEKNSSET